VTNFMAWPQFLQKPGRALERWAPWRVWTVVLVLTGLVIAGDVITGADVLFTPLYFVPIALGAWFVGPRLAWLVALLATSTWLVVDRLDHPTRTVALHAWNLVVQALVFSTVALVMTRLRAALSTERAGRADAERDLQHAQRLTTVGRMAAGIAHELGTPLNVVGSYARMVAQGEIEGAEVKETARIISEQTDFMTGIIKQMLDFARSQQTASTVVSVVELVKDSVKLLAPLVRERQVALELGATEQTPRVEFDVAQLRQVLSNLVMNAVQASRQGQRVQVQVELVDHEPPLSVERRARDWVVVRVKDEGRGMSDEVRQRVFDPFFTTKPIGEGTGLGLSVAWGIVQRHGGWIDVESAEGRGSCFSVYLPPHAA
jgi:signal transduction histidine kinase